VNPFFLVVALVDLGGVFMHGLVGHRLFITPLKSDRLFPTSLFGDAAWSRRVFMVTWHAVTAVFAVSAAMMLLMAFGAVASPPAALFVSAIHVGFLVVALAVSGRRIAWPPRRMPLGFVMGMSTAALMGWLGTL
jgi:hypothetical protein